MYVHDVGLVAKIRNLLTGEPEDPVEKAEWMAEKAEWTAEEARISGERAAANDQARSDLPGWKPPE